MKSFIYAFFIFYLSVKCQAQNLPSLLLEKNINATFSILAYDENAQEWGIAVATNNLCVGNSTIYIKPGIGAFSVIAETEPAYASNGFGYLLSGKSIEEAINLTKEKDEEWFYRQVSGIDANGNVYAFTGSALKYWKGTSSHLTGDKFVVIGNQLADGVLETMSETYKNAKGTLAEKLLKSLIAGQNTGGQIQGKQSAALMVKGIHNEWYNNIDLRVDHAAEPFQDLQKLLNYHYGRIRLNQAVYAFRNKNAERGQKLLNEAKVMTEGWNGIYSKIAMAYLLYGEEKEAIVYIKKGLAENPAWKENLPAFYILKNHPDLKGMIDENTFTEKDWSSALLMMLNIGQTEKAVKISEKLIQKYPTSLMYYLYGKSCFELGEQKKAVRQLEKSLQLDESNEEAKRLLKALLIKE
ncbi:DUF1028 domain-containing protein [Flavobacterium ajazii]|uniref:DUF1028 domain-containing protein n=1 Tax=Flavobacterium ajazii TaxID=2692318 RepID=UPI0013D1F17F|nr:DUF1028 domain-containing protein [Flavobacterium ajazii]